MAPAALALAALLLAPSAGGSGPRAALLPLLSAGDVDSDEALGMSALLRDVFDDAAYLKARSGRDKDERTARKCKLKPKCLAKAADKRGVELLAAGTVSATDDGYGLTLVVVRPKKNEIFRTVTEEAHGEPEEIRVQLDRLLRRAFHPETLAGGVMVVGEPDGAQVLLDGELAATLPMDEPIAGVLEGDHTIEVTAPGYRPLRRPVSVMFHEVTEVEAVLRLAGAAEAQTDKEAEGSSLWVINLWGPAAVAGAATALVAAGAVAGAFSYLDHSEVQRRAAAGLLVFPRDELLIRRGEALAWTANGLYAASAVTIVAAATWLGVGLLLKPSEKPVVVRRRAKRGAPTADELDRGDAGESDEDEPSTTDESGDEEDQADEDAELFEQLPDGDSR